MISDTLFDGVEELQRYLRDFDCYQDDSEMVGLIKATMTIMDATRAELDAEFCTLPAQAKRKPIAEALRTIANYFEKNP